MDDHSSPLEGFGSLLRLTGYTVPARARFVGESVFAGIYTGTTLGLVCGQFGMICTPIGPLVPFVCGSAFGYCFGIYGSYKRSVELARTYAHSYPKLLAHALWVEHHIAVPENIIQQNQLEEWITGYGLKRLSLAILAAQACRTDVQDVENIERQRLIDEHATYIANDKDNNNDDE